MQEVKNLVNILVGVGMILFIVYMVGDFILVDLENGSYGMLLTVIAVLIFGWANNWNFNK